MRDAKKELQAIELGKEWMRRSVNLAHDYEHAENVAKHSHEIFESFKREGLLTEDDRNITLLAVWWHDSYKAQQAKERLFYGIFFEGIESAKIFRREVGHLLSKEVLRKAEAMIKIHNMQGPVFLVFWWLYTPLFRTLHEADYIEVYREKRIVDSIKVHGFPMKILSTVYYGVMPFFMNLLPQSDYLKNFLRTRK
jgi:hypothetical protein